MKDDFKSFYVAVILSACVVFGINHFFPKEKTETKNIEQVAEVDAPIAESSEVVVKNNVPTTISVSKALASNPRLMLKNNDLSGSIRLYGMRFDDLLLSKYKQTLENNSPDVELLMPAKTKKPYYAEYGWLSNDASLDLPNSNTKWTVLDNNELTQDKPVTLIWENKQGLKFVNKISLDENYLFDIEQTVENNSGSDINLMPYGLFSKYVDVEEQSRSVVHEGFTAILDGKLKEVGYNKFPTEENSSESFTSKGGWISFSDRYWFSAFIFDNNYPTKTTLRRVKNNLYQLDFKGETINLKSGNVANFNSKLYSGAKEIKLLDKYAQSIDKFDLNVDFGWYYFITKPFFYILDYLFQLIGNMGWAILLFAALLRLVMFPVANKSFESMSKMKKVQPKVMALQEMYKDDKVALQRATMELYKKEKVNPASGCLPMFIQIPIFFSLYKVLNIAIEIRHAPFIGWITDLSAPDPLTISTWAHIYVPSMLDIGVWPLIYGITMFLQQKLNPAPANKDQARMFAMMPIIFTIMFAHFASGLVIYWTLSNILSLIQQRLIMYKNGVK